MNANVHVSEINAALDARHDQMTADELTYLVQSNFSGSLLSLRQLKPFIEEIKRRFKHLPRKVGVDGNYKTIAGHRNFKSWCAGILNRTDRAVRYMLVKAQKPKDKKEKKGEEQKTKETISAVSERVKKYLQNQVDRFEGSERVEILENIFNVITEMAQDGAA